MSYIRALSNPEGLYIIGTRGGKVEIMGCPDWGGSKTDPPLWLTMPCHAFEGVIKKWQDSGFEDTRYRGAVMIEMTLDRLSLDVRFDEPETWKIAANNYDLYKFRLMYPEKWGPDGVNAWTVTWCYVANNIRRRSERKAIRPVRK